jgi:hypothetical protein
MEIDQIPTLDLQRQDAKVRGRMGRDKESRGGKQSTFSVPLVDWHAAPVTYLGQASQPHPSPRQVEVPLFLHWLHSFHRLADWEAAARDAQWRAMVAFCAASPGGAVSSPLCICATAATAPAFTNHHAACRSAANGQGSVEKVFLELFAQRSSRVLSASTTPDLGASRTGVLGNTAYAPTHSLTPEMTCCPWGKRGGGGCREC